MSKVKPSLTDPAIATFCAEVNVLGTANVLEAAEAFQVKKLVYAGEQRACNLRCQNEVQHCSAAGMGPAKDRVKQLAFTQELHGFQFYA